MFERWAIAVTGEDAALPGWVVRILSVCCSLAQAKDAAECEWVLSDPRGLEIKRGWQCGSIGRAMQVAQSRGWLANLELDDESLELSYSIAFPS